MFFFPYPNFLYRGVVSFVSRDSGFLYLQGAFMRGALPIPHLNMYFELWSKILSLRKKKKIEISFCIPLT